MARSKSSSKPRIIAFANFKGGVGKTASSVRLAEELARSGNRVLLADFDPQANASDHHNATLPQEALAEAGAYQLLTERLEPEACIHRTEFSPNLHLIPASLALAMAEQEMGRDLPAVLRLKPELQALPYDFIVIDTPPSYQYPLKAALYAADLVLTPTNHKTDSLKGLGYVRLVIAELFSPQIRLKPAEHRALPTILSQKQAERLREDLMHPPEGHPFLVTRTAITNSRALDSAMIKKVPLSTEGSAEEQETVRQFSELCAEVA